MLTYLKAGTIKRIHVDRRVMAQNAKLPPSRWKPAYTVQTSKGSHKAVRVELHGHQVFDQRMKPLSCGARMYGETRAAVEITR